MKQVAALGNEEFILGFRLAGVGKAFVISEEDPDGTVRELLSNHDIGLIILQEDTLEHLAEETKERISNSIEPVFLTLTEDDSNEEMRKLIKKSIGVDLWNKD